MDTMLAHIYSTETTEFDAINQPTPAIDTTDWPLTSTLVDSSNPN
jgi:hypothetical protein